MTLSVEPEVPVGIRMPGFQCPMIDQQTNRKLYLTELANRALPITSRLSASTSFTCNRGSASGTTTTLSEERTGVTLWKNIDENQWLSGLALGPRTKNFPGRRFRYQSRNFQAKYSETYHHHPQTSDRFNQGSRNPRLLDVWRRVYSEASQSGCGGGLERGSAEILSDGSTLIKPK